MKNELREGVEDVFDGVIKQENCWRIDSWMGIRIEWRISVS